MDDLLVLGVGKICPNCGGTQFSISCPPRHMPRPELPPGVLGFADCRSCQRKFLVKLAPELYNSFVSAFNDRPEIRNEVLKTLFP